MENETAQISPREEIKKNLKDFKQKFTKSVGSKMLVRLLEIVGIIVIALIIFSAGIVVGFHKANFGRAWGEHYNENFGIGHPNGFLGDLDKIGVLNNFPNAHGAVGKIIKVELPNIIVQDRGNTEKVVAIADDTTIQEGGDIVTSTDLHTDDFVVVIGSPNTEGVIEAKLIRVMPSPEYLK